MPRTLTFPPIPAQLPGPIYQELECLAPLYLDHHGTWVWCDVKGFGSYDVDGDLEVLVDGNPSAQNGEFKKDLYITGTCGSSKVILGSKLPYCSTETTLLLQVDDPETLASCGYKVRNASLPILLSSNLCTGEQLEAIHKVQLNESTLTIPVPHGQKGLVITKLFDAFHGRQSARVLVDNHEIGAWFIPEEDRTNRWHFSRFGIVGEHLTSSTARLTIDPVAGSALWSVAAYWLTWLKELK